MKRIIKYFFNVESKEIEVKIESERILRRSNQKKVNLEDEQRKTAAMRIREIK
jgi:hypothetical protein